MIDVEKIYTDNPFVDNLLYYSKFIALNSVIKDEEEALKNETTESLKAGNIYLSCYEGHSVFEMFDDFPQEILKNYIDTESNLDLLVNSGDVFLAYLDGLSLYRKNQMLNNLAKLARIIYIDHYEVMVDYINKIGPNWAIDNEPLYNACMDATATYVELFDVIPEHTRKRVLKYYLNNYDNSNIDDLSSDLSIFQEYIDNRIDTNINNELDKINTALRSIFISHYDMMIQRGYVSKDAKNNWIDYMHFEDAYKRCLKNQMTYKQLFPLFPKDDLLEVLIKNIGEDNVNTYLMDIVLDDETMETSSVLTDDVAKLEDYFINHCSNPEESTNLTKDMTHMYIANYNSLVNFDIYNKCKAEDAITYLELRNYLPKETQKIILNTEIDETSNIEIYSTNLKMLNSYFNTLEKSKVKEIKDAIAKDMRIWYLDNYVEKNNYYRTMLGLPYLDKNNKRYKDTLFETYDEKSDQYIKFGNKFLNMIPKGIYPDIHWNGEICDFDDYDISILNEYGVIDAYIQECKRDIADSRYDYMRFLGDNKLDIYTCRKALNFQLIGMPTVDNTFVKNKFKDKFAINRDYVIRTIYSDAYKFKSDYYNKFIIVFILINTIMDVVGDVPRMIIDREVFDSRCIKYLFEAYGIPYYSEIPVKYQQAMLKNLNILIKYKSSTKNMIDICKLFGFSDIRVFGYYMFKDRETDSNTGEFLFNDDNSINYDLNALYVRDKNGEILDLNGLRYTKLLDYRDYREEVYLQRVTVKDSHGNISFKNIINNKADVYIRDEDTNSFIPLLDTDYFHKIKANTDVATLKFIKVPIDEELTDYKNDPDNIIKYNEVVSEDDTWDGGLDHDYIEQKILDYEFNAVLTKYISVETVTQMTELSFQVSYFYNMLFDNLYSEEKLTVKIPFIKVGHEFKFMDVVCYLFALMYLYNNIEDNIMYSPTQILYIKGYNFNSDLDKVLEDVNAFTQPEDPMERENIFDINERIKKDKYDYREAFKDYDIKAFNLEADVDALEEWLNVTHQLSLDDFVVDDTLTQFDQIITLRNFFSLNNSFYQKDIFMNALLPSQYNQDIKYAFGCDLYPKILFSDIDGNKHYVVKEYIMDGDVILDSYYMNLVDDKSDEIFIINFDKYMIDRFKNEYALYNKYIKNENAEYILDSVDYYKMHDTGEYALVFTGNIYVKNENGEYVFSADHYYTKNKLDEFVEITEDKYFITDSNGKTVINLGDYYILVNGEYVLNPDNCYVMVERDGVVMFVLLRDVDQYGEVERIDSSNCYVLRNGKFISMLDTDHYTPTKVTDEDYEFIEEDYYIRVDTPTEYVDNSIDPPIYYKKLDDYYKESDYIVYEGVYYVRDPDGNYIDETHLIKPDNCYFESEGDYKLVLNNIMTYVNYETQISNRYTLVLQPNNNYNRYVNIDGNLILANDPLLTYVRDSDERYLLVLHNDALYDNTHTMIVVLNKDIDDNLNKIEEELSKYNPEETDGVWDENDWFYPDPSYADNAVGMNGENKWYYKKPGEELIPEDETEEEKVGSGFYLDAETYIGSVELEEGCRYYMSMDIETNFDGRIQIYCESDDSCVDTTSRCYDVIAEEIQHVDQLFIANNIKRPRILFLIYDFDINPIENGDYIIVKNIRFIKSNNSHYIAQDIPSYDKLQEIYRTNEAIYKYLIRLMAECDDFDTYMIYKKLYDSLMTSKYNKEAFKLKDGTYAKTYTDFLQARDSVLYERLTYFKSLDPDTMHKEVADNIIEVTYAIDDCVDTYSYGYLYSYFPAVSANYIQQYISKIIDFFKSWKVHLLGINTIYRFDDPLENKIKILEDQQYRTRINNQISHVVVNDSLKINPIDSKDPSGIKYTDKYEDLYTFTHSYGDLVDIKDRVRIISRTADMIRYKDNYTKIELHLNDDTIDARIDENGDLIVNDDSGLSVALPNDLILSDDYDENTTFAAQNIEKINKDSMDII